MVGYYFLAMIALRYILLYLSSCRTKNAEQPQMVSDQEKSFASLVTAYLNNDAQLVQPYVAGGYHYR